MSRVNRQLHSEIHRDTRAFLSLQREWNPLLLHSPANTIFLTWEWQKTWWDCFGQSWELCLLELRDGDDLVGLAPLYTLEAPSGLRSLQFVGGVEVSDYLDLIVATDSEEAVYEALWQVLVEKRALEWDVLDLHNVPATSPSLERLTTLAGAGREFEVTDSVEEVCPVIHLPATWEEYLSSLNKKQRHEVRRKLRKADREAEVHWYYAEDSASLEAEVNDFISLHRKSAVEKEAFMDERMQEFFQRVARLAFERGWLRLAFLALDGAKAAAMFCFEYEGKYLVYNSGYDPQLYPSLSSGIVLLAYCIQDAIDRGLGAFDFLRGEEEYKYRFGGVRTEVRNLRIARQRSSSV
jgi:CelD/BcsL family acetyltransferase involved in cellulose biosynthesis